MDELKMINKIKEYLDKKDYEGLYMYIRKKEKELLDKRQDEASKYIDTLINNLK